jgi:AraC-like DNA-binding protein
VAARNETELYVIPDGCVDFVLTASDRSGFGGHLSGAMEAAMTVVPEPNATLLGVRFRPGGAMRFIRRPLTDLRGGAADLADVFGAGAAELYDRLQQISGGVRERVRVLDEALQQWLAIASDAPFDPVVANVLHDIYRTSGNVTLHDAAARQAVSSRHLLRRFAAWTGHSPKMFCRVIRFQRAVNTIVRANGNVRGTELAYGSGYADQAHLVREFRALSGMTPQLYAKLAAMSDLFNTAEAYLPYNQSET